MIDDQWRFARILRRPDYGDDFQALADELCEFSYDGNPERFATSFNNYRPHWSDGT